MSRHRELASFTGHRNSDRVRCRRDIESFAARRKSDRVNIIAAVVPTKSDELVEIFGSYRKHDTRCIDTRLLRGAHAHAKPHHIHDSHCFGHKRTNSFGIYIPEITQRGSLASRRFVPPHYFVTYRPTFGGCLLETLCVAVRVTLWPEKSFSHLAKTLRAWPVKMTTRSATPYAAIVVGGGDSSGMLKGIQEVSIFVCSQ